MEFKAYNTESTPEAVKRHQEMVEKRRIQEDWDRLSVELGKAEAALANLHENEVVTPIKLNDFLLSIKKIIDFTKAESEKGRIAAKKVEGYSDFKSFIDELGKSLEAIRKGIVVEKAFHDAGSVKEQYQKQMEKLADGSKIVEKIVEMDGELVEKAS